MGGGGDAQGERLEVREQSHKTKPQEEPFSGYEAKWDIWLCAECQSGGHTTSPPPVKEGRCGPGHTDSLFPRAKAAHGRRCFPTNPRGGPASRGCSQKPLPG